MDNSLGKIDVSEEGLIAFFGKEVLELLLHEHAYDRNETSTKHNIIWATDNYDNEGKGFHFSDEIKIECITGQYYKLIRPRVTKSKEEQQKRTRDKAEVFTPSWVCNTQNNLVDAAWFGRDNVFNKETCKKGKHDWQPTEDKIDFPEGKSWQDYVNDNRLEMSCGEAPYLTSRYDTTTGEYFENLNKRIGLLDRKLRVVGENVSNIDEWFLWAFNALKSTYGFEWQGDSLLLAREAILCTFMDYYKDFAYKNNIAEDTPPKEYIKYAAYIISWNIFQMDGIKAVIPSTCHDVLIKNERQLSLFEDNETEDQIVPCEGCKKNNIHKHNGIYQVVADWDKTKWDINELPIEISEFHTLIKND